MHVFKVYRNFLKVLGIAILILLASFIGRHRAQESQKQILSTYFPDSIYQITPVNDSKWFVYNKSFEKESYIYFGEGLGYNGKVHVLVQTGLDKLILRVIPVKHHESPSFYKKLGKNQYFEKKRGKDISQFLEDKTIDIVSGATISSKAVNQAIQNGYSKGENITITQLSYPVFGFLEYLVSGLLIAGFFITKIKARRLKRSLLWISMILSFVLLGLNFNQHITLSRISAMLSGYFPGLNNELYFYILVFGSILILLSTRKNIYCHSVCPFGVAQEILAKTGNAKPFRPKYLKKLKLLQRLIALTAILISLALNNPALAQYEIFGAFFQLTANTIIFGVLIIIIVLSLFIIRPWCNFMCPIDSGFEYLKFSRKSIVELWKK